MDDTFYIISRGFTGKALTTAQRKSSLFAEEPTVLGKVLRRGSQPMRLTPAEYDANEVRLKQLEAAGSIKITPPGIRGLTVDQTILDEVNFSDAEKVANAKALEQQRMMQEQQALAALEADNKAKAEAELVAAEELKMQLKAAEDLKAAKAPKVKEVEQDVPLVEEPVLSDVVPDVIPAPAPSAPKAEVAATEEAAAPVAEVVSVKHDKHHDKKSHSSKKGKG